MGDNASATKAGHSTRQLASACSTLKPMQASDYSNHVQEESAQESGLALQQDETTADPQPDGDALAVEDKWVLNEPNREMTRVQSYKAEKNSAPIPLEHLEDTRATKFEYEDGTLVDAGLDHGRG